MGGGALGAPGAGPPGAGRGTLDESVWATLRRDAGLVAGNVRAVVLPFGGAARRGECQAVLRNWDLWGPLVFTLVLALTLTAGSAKEKAAATFSIVFSVLSVGALVLTANVILLGGSIGFFQALCLIGYCLFPLDIAALVCLAVPLTAVRMIITLAAVVWASYASVPFISASVPPERKVLATYPVMLLYVFLCWLSLVSG